MRTFLYVALGMLFLAALAIWRGSSVRVQFQSGQHSASIEALPATTPPAKSVEQAPAS
jgi:hypothetical protein